MSDDIDRAQAREAEWLADALAQPLPAGGASLLAMDYPTLCILCDEEIPEGRRRVLPGVQTCIEC